MVLGLRITNCYHAGVCQVAEECAGLHTSTGLVLQDSGQFAADAPCAGDHVGNVTTKSQLKVMTGNLSLSESSLPSPVSAAAAMCLVQVDGLGSKAAPFSRLKADICQ